MRMAALAILLGACATVAPDVEREPAPPGINDVWIRVWDPAVEGEPAFHQACGRKPQSVLERYLLGSELTAMQIVVELSPAAGPPERLLGELACHRAWMLQDPAAANDDCPLELPGLLVEIEGDADKIIVKLGVRDETLVDELHRRATTLRSPGGTLQDLRL